MGHCTHLATDDDHVVEEDKVNDYSHEGRQACKGVNLAKKLQFSGRPGRLPRKKRRAYHDIPRWSTDRDDALG